MTTNKLTPPKVPGMKGGLSRYPTDRLGLRQPHGV